MAIELYREIPQLTDPADVDLSGKVAIVTGGVSGIGRNIALKLAEHGANVVVNSTEKSEAAGCEMVELAKQQELSGELHYICGNIMKPQVRKRLITETTERFGGLNILVNNAGIEHIGFMLGYDQKVARRIIEVKQISSFLLTQLALRPFLRQKEGDVVNISSIVAGKGIAGDAAYASANRGQEGWALSLAQEVAHKGIKVNTVRPGLVKGTGITLLGGDKDKQDALEAAFIERSEEGRTVEPDEISDGVLSIIGTPGYTGQIKEIAAGYR